MYSISFKNFKKNFIKNLPILIPWKKNLFWNNIKYNIYLKLHFKNWSGNFIKTIYKENATQKIDLNYIKITDFFEFYLKKLLNTINDFEIRISLK